MARRTGLAIMGKVYRLSEKFATKKCSKGEIACGCISGAHKRAGLCLR